MHALLTLLLYRCCHFAIDVLDSSLLPTLNVVGIVVAKRSQRSRVVGVASSLRPLQIDARRVQNRPSEAPKSTLRGFKIDLRSPRQVKKRPRSVPAASKSVPRAPKSAPRASQERPKSVPRAPQELPRAPQETPQSAKRRPGEPLGTILRLERSKKRLSKAICRATWSRSAFGTIFGRFSKHARKRRTLILKRPYRGFAVFYESPRLRSSRPARAKKQRKSIKNDPPGAPKSSPVESKLRLEASLEGHLESKLLLEANLKGQVALGVRL